MTPEFYERVREVFHAACQLSGRSREDLIASMSAGDPLLVREVRELLAHHDDDSDALADSNLSLARERLHHGLTGPYAENDSDVEDFPEAIGRYRIIRRIGEGGMGIVFEAEQTQPSRRVAVKLLRLSWGSRQLFRRFEHEAEMLGRLKHVGIAHIYEAGIHQTATLARVPYLAMELIDGEPITQYAERHGLSTHQRLRLVASVCEAVEHAHLNGVIHRDLKPGNILIDRHGQPKVLDFGIARATDADVRMTTMETSTGQLLGTIPYMSPEQVSGERSSTDARSDVYSLGLVLYELLAGRLPYEVKGRHLAAAVRIIQQEEPTRISSIDHRYRGDIETLIAKALEKDRSRRYQSAGALRDDILRLLSNRPLVARPPRVTYQLKKFAQRHRAMVAAAALILLLLIGGVTGTTWGWISARQANIQLGEAVADARAQRDRAIDSEKVAATELARAEQSRQFLHAMLRSVHPAVARDRDTFLLRQILEAAVEKMDRGDLSEVPTVEAEMRTTIAEVYTGIGDNAAALEVIRPALELARRAAPSEAHRYRYPRVYYASTLASWGRYLEAADAYDSALGIQENGISPEDEIAAMLYAGYGGVQARMGHVEEALALHRKSLDVRLKIMGEGHGDVAASMGNIAGCLKDLGRLEEALEMMQDALAIYANADPPRLMHMTILENNISDLLLIMDRPLDAEETSRHAVEICREAFPPGHQQNGVVAHTLGRALRRQGRYEEAAIQFARSSDVLQNAFDGRHVFVAIARMDLGITLAELGRFAEAERELLAAYDIHANNQNATDDSADGCRDAIVALYERWDEAHPGEGHDDEAASWRADGTGD